MKVALEKAEAIVASVRELYRRLALGQRIALFAVVGLVLVSLAFLALREGRPAGEAVQAKGASKAAPGTGDAEEPELLSAGGFWGLQTPEDRKARQRSLNRRKLEQALCGEKVVEATVVLHTGSQPRFSLQEEAGDSAAVKLTLREGIDSLKRQEADALRELVCCALSVRPERVSIMDSHGRAYPSGGTLGAEARLYEDEESWRKCIRSLITEYYSYFFNDLEFYVAVVVYLSTEQTTIEKEEFDPERTFSKVRSDDSHKVEEHGEGLSGGMGPCKADEASRRISVKSRTEEEVFPARAMTRTSVPRGTLEKVSVSVLLDLEAVKRKITAVNPNLAGRGFDSLPSGERERVLVAYREELEAGLRSLLRPYKDASATVVLQPFAKGPQEPEAEAQPLLAAGGAGSPGVTPRRGSVLVPVLLWTGLLCVVASLSWALVRGLRRRSELRMDHEYPMSPSRREGAEWGMRRNVGEAVKRWNRRTGNVAGKGWLQDGLLETVDDTSRRVKRRPEVTAAVLRFWLSQDIEEEAKGT